MVSDFFYPNVGGVEGHILAISKSLAERGHRVIIITHAYKPSRFGVRHLSPGLTIYYLPVRVLANQDTLPNFFTSHPLMRQIFIGEGIQLVHGHQALSSLAHEAIFHARTLGIKTVFTDHSLFSLDEDAASVLTNKLLRFVLSDVDRVVCVSYTGKENTVLRAAIKDPDRIVSVIPNAVDSTRFYPPDPPLVPPDRITIVVLSRLMYRKGIDLLLEAIPRICRLHPHVDFLIGGDGPKRVDLEQMRERHLFLIGRVSLVGAVRQGSVRDHLIQGQIFLSPSLTEAFGTSLIEAASCGLLVVATSVGGVPEVLPEEMMYLAEPSSTSLVQKTSEAIRRLEGQGSLMTHDPWASHAAMAKMYNWDSISQRLEGVYHSAMMEEPTTMMTRLEKYWDNSGGWAAGVVFCIVIMVDMWFGMMLEMVWPADSIEKRISKKEDDLAFEEETDDAIRSR